MRAILLAVWSAFFCGLTLASDLYLYAAINGLVCITMLWFAWDDHRRTVYQP